MVFVYLKNLLFPPDSIQQAENGRKGKAPSPKFTIPKYGSFGNTRPESSHLSPGHESNSQSSDEISFPRSDIDIDVDVEQALGFSAGNVNCEFESTGDHDHDSSVDSNSTSGSKINSSCFKFSPRVISDAIIGLSDGLTVPFALTAGLSTFNDTKVVVYGGLAELIAGSISMGLGGWLAARGECEYYHSTVAHTLSQINAFHSRSYHGHEFGNTLSHDQLQYATPTSGSPTPPDPEFSLSPIPQQVNSIFSPYSLPPALHSSLVNHILSPSYPRDQLLSLLIRQHHNLSPPEDHRAHVSAFTIAGGYFFGGFVPLLPYFFVERQEVLKGLVWSVGVMAVCLFLFGAWKTVAMDNEGGTGITVEWEAEGRNEEVVGLLPMVMRGSGSVRRRKITKVLRGGVEMVMVGGIAAGGAMGIVRFLGSIGE